MSIFGFAPLVWKKLSIGVVILLITAFLWVNASFVYGAFADTVRTILLVYLVLYAIMVASFKGKIPIFQRGIADLQNFIITFVGTTIIMMFIPLFLLQQASVETIILATGFGFLHAGVKAYIEEIVFRWILPIGFGMGDWLANAFFGLFHMGVLSSVLIATGMAFELAIATSIIPMIALFALGMVWSQLRNWGGLPAAIGSHYAYNLVVLGVWGIILGVA